MKECSLLMEAKVIGALAVGKVEEAFPRTLALFDEGRAAR